MIRAVMHGNLKDTGKVRQTVILGVVDANLRRLRNGSPIMVPIGRMVVDAAMATPVDAENIDFGEMRVIIVHGETHEEIVRIMSENGEAELPDELLASAIELDERLRAEGELP